MEARIQNIAAQIDEQLRKSFSQQPVTKEGMMEAVLQQTKNYLMHRLHKNPDRMKFAGKVDGDHVIIEPCNLYTAALMGGEEVIEYMDWEHLKEYEGKYGTYKYSGDVVVFCPKEMIEHLVVNLTMPAL